MSKNEFTIISLEDNEDRLAPETIQKVINKGFSYLKEEWYPHKKTVEEAIDDAEKLAEGELPQDEEGYEALKEAKKSLTTPFNKMEKAGKTFKNDVSKLLINPITDKQKELKERVEPTRAELYRKIQEYERLDKIAKNQLVIQHRRSQLEAFEDLITVSPEYKQDEYLVDISEADFVKLLQNFKQEWEARKAEIEEQKRIDERVDILDKEGLVMKNSEIKSLSEEEFTARLTELREEKKAEEERKRQEEEERKKEEERRQEELRKQQEEMRKQEELIQARQAICDEQGVSLAYNELKSLSEEDFYQAVEDAKKALLYETRKNKLIENSVWLLYKEDYSEDVLFNASEEDFSSILSKLIKEKEEQEMRERKMHRLSLLANKNYQDNWQEDFSSLEEMHDSITHMSESEFYNFMKILDERERAKQVEQAQSEENDVPVVTEGTIQEVIDAYNLDVNTTKFVEKEDGSIELYTLKLIYHPKKK